MDKIEHMGYSDEHYTPQWIFDQLGVVFDLDVASSGQDFVPALKRYTKEDDGLSQPWQGLVWMNPPYSEPKPWVERWLRHGNGFALLPFSNGKWLDALHESEAIFALMPRSRMNFIRPDGTRNGVRVRVALWALGDAISILGSSFDKCR